jgi:hypothetical protein
MTGNPRKRHTAGRQSDGSFGLWPMLRLPEQDVAGVGGGRVSYDDAAFRLLQGRLAEWWPVLTVRTVPPRPRVLVMVSSLPGGLPEYLRPMLASYEERNLCYVMALARSEHTRVIYVTSMPILPRLASYYLDLVADLTPPEVAERLTVVSLSDPSDRPLARKILDRPLLLQRLRALIGDTRYGLLMPYLVSGLEAELAVALGVPVYGPDPALRDLGSKSGSREVFAAAGVPVPRGVSGLRDREDIVDAMHELQQTAPVRRAAVKTDYGFSGQGNALVDLQFAQDRPAIAESVDRLLPDDSSLTAGAFLDAFSREGGVVEEWVDGEASCSPSVQLRASPLGEVEVLSTHDQILGGPGGQTYMGCRFPAATPFIEPLTRLGRAVGSELSRRGVIGRFGIDFVCARTAGGWRPYALEVNLRNGGTTHPAITLLALTDGTYDQTTGELMARTGPKFYTATDHLQRVEYTRLTPDDVLDVVAATGLGWNPADETGIALHMVSGIAAAGNLGATAIAGSAPAADDLMSRLRSALDDACGVGATPSLTRA